jgi:hypothetical protein
VRHDSDALFALFHIRLASVTDLQLMELGSTNVVHVQPTEIAKINSIRASQVRKKSR